ncbi:amidohydrolase family protein [Mucilaginibacter sp. E4BP6]|uniref:amidohydrolase family protein n=1 Tax=Mucilaginibacter sp. E4BP6 TaxID=2723089 RepID=UPI0015CEB832|nr:amidohydrolase family protein [Mucilaginibacter sp. E4BP6]NYE65802.1 L-fuconolactonase [Mucilaginibacter sp. E4BP6]
MLRIDSHQHFWKYDPVRYDWIDDNMSVIQKDFLPEDLAPILKANGFDGCITVQSHQSEQENEFQLANADEHDFIKGVVGWVDLQSPKIEERLAYYQQFEKLKGFRHVLQGESQRDFMLRPDFLKGISMLKKYSYTYDILILPDQLKYTTEFVSQFPDQRFVIDHIAKPNIEQKELKDWEKDIKVVAAFENVHCKVSGLVTEADWRNWQPADFNNYLEVVTNSFGTKRLMYGSDWPVCKVAAGYGQVVNIVKDYFSAFSQTEQHAFFGGNAIEFYNI